MAYTIAGITLGQVQSESQNKASGLISINDIDADSTSNLFIEFSSPTRDINVTGSFTGISLAALRAWIVSINALVDGNQDETVIYSSDLFGGDINVMLISWSFTFNSGVPNEIIYSMRMSEGIGVDNLS